MVVEEFCKLTRAHCLSLLPLPSQELSSTTCARVPASVLATALWPRNVRPRLEEVPMRWLLSMVRLGFVLTGCAPIQQGALRFRKRIRGRLARALLSSRSRNLEGTFLSVRMIGKLNVFFPALLVILFFLGGLPGTDAAASDITLVFDGSGHPEFAGSVNGPLAIDSAGVLRLMTIENYTGGLKVHSISPSGSLKWSTGSLAGGFFTREGMLVGPGDRAYVYVDKRLFAIDKNGQSVPGWPQSFDLGDDPSVQFANVQPVVFDLGTNRVFAKVGGTNAYLGLRSGVFARRPNGRPAWDKRYDYGGGFYPLVRGPGGDLFTANWIRPDGVGGAIGSFVRLDQFTGAEMCSVEIDTDSDQIQGGAGGVFTSLSRYITSYDAGCGGTTLHTSTRYRLGLSAYNEAAQVVIGWDSDRAPDGNLDPASIRLIGVSADGMRSWRNDEIGLNLGGAYSGGRDGPVRAQRGTLLYIIGTDLGDFAGDRIFVVDAASGAITRRVDTGGVCPSCDLAVGADGTIYLSDRNQRVYKVNRVGLCDLAAGFDYPIGPPYVPLGTRVTEANDGDGWYVAQEFWEWNPQVQKNHLGEDWNSERGPDDDLGKPVYAAANGTVVYARDAGTGWNGVIIVHHQGNFVLASGKSVTDVWTTYGHLDVSRVNDWVTEGACVTKGDQIGVIGPKPQGSSGPHLHLEIRRTKPRSPDPVGPGYSDTKMGRVDASDFIDRNRGF
jgi:hypothetical protein